MSKPLDELLKEANEALKDIRVSNRKHSICQKKRTNCLYLRGMFPPKPGSNKKHWHQQEIALGLSASPQGVKAAKQKANQILCLLDQGQFDWQPYRQHKHAVQPNSTATIAEWIKAFEEDYFSTCERTAEKETTWDTEYIAFLTLMR